jgi:hypothetical protein
MLHLWCMVSVHVLVLSLVDCGFDINQIHTIKSYIGGFFSNHTVLRSKTKDWLSWDQDNKIIYYSLHLGGNEREITVFGKDKI